ncbi:hypothetical protein Ancab_034846 [Ancistrocladus abbreviatus]
MTSSTENNQTSPPHLLLFPFPSKGHTIPLLDLAHRLLTRHSRHLTITVLLTPPNLPLLQPLLSLHRSSSLQTLILSPPGDGDSPKRLIPTIRSLRLLQTPILDWFRSHPSPPTAILSDFFLGWTHHLAVEAGVPRLVFCPSGAAGTAEFYTLWRDAPENNQQNPNFEICFEKIPNKPKYHWWQISHVYKNGREGNSDWELFRDCVVCNLKSWGTVSNSFTELERVYIDYLREQMGDKRVWAVGPLLPPEEDSAVSYERGGPNSIPAEDVLRWLDGRTDGSVVYVCFGSRTSLTDDQMVALGTALERSGVHFLWCVRESEARIPNREFEDRVAGRALIIQGWAPQLAILRHRAVGAFLTHCGWNSVLESITTGVLMLAWPMGADQFSNARLLVQELGVAMRVRCEGLENVPDWSELARLLAESVSGDRVDRERIKKLMIAALDAVKEGGSSSKNLDELVYQLTPTEPLKI